MGGDSRRIFVLLQLLMCLVVSAQWSRGDASEVQRLRVYYLFGDIEGFYLKNFDGLELVLHWTQFNRQAVVMHNATRSDLLNALQDPLTDLIFWVGHGDKNGILDCDKTPIREADFEVLGKNLRGILMLSCFQNDFYKKIQSHLLDKNLPIPTFWSIGDPNQGRAVLTSQTQSLFSFPNLKKIFEESHRDPCENLLITRPG